VGKKKLTIAGGIGFPDLMNLSLRLTFGQDQLGISGGYMPDWRGDYYSFSIDYFRHYGGYSRLSYFKPWFFRTGFTLIIEEDSEPNMGRTAYYPLIYIRIGREFNISKRFGFSIDIGLAPTLSLNGIIPYPAGAIILYYH